MSKIILVTGASNSGKSELLTKLYETILRWYDNYDLKIEKQPINSFGDFLADITIKRNTSFKKNEEKYSEEVNCNDNKIDCCNNESKPDNNEPKPDNEEKGIRILINTAGDELENFILLDKKIKSDYDFLIMTLRKEDKDKSKSLSLRDIYVGLESHPGRDKNKNVPIPVIETLFGSVSVELSNNYYKVREKNLMCIMKEIVCYTCNNL